MPGEPLDAPPSLLPRRLLYSIFARIGEHGLGTDALENALAAYRAGFLEKIVGYDNRQTEIPAHKVRSLRLHPVRLISFIERPLYYGAKKKYLDWIVARMLARGDYDFFHSWSGDCLESLRVAKQRGIPSVLEIPTWHRKHGRMNRVPDAPASAASWRKRFHLPLERFLEEYELADLLLVLSEKAAESFRNEGFPEEKIFRLPNGVDTERFRPGQRPEIFRAIFSGALTSRKGVHTLLEAWSRLALPNAELWLIGNVHDEVKPFLQQFWREDIKLIGFVRDVENYLRQGTIYVFPSELEGNAKTLNEAAACGLPAVTTREAGDVYRDGVEGVIVPPLDVDALVAGIRRLYDDPDEVARMSNAARRRAVENFTWDHCRAQLLHAYSRVLSAKRGNSG